MVLSITNSTIFEDLDVVEKIKKLGKKAKIALKGSLFFNPQKEVFEQLQLDDVDFLIGEIEFIIGKLIRVVEKETYGEISTIQGISFKISGEWTTNAMHSWSADGDVIPFPIQKMNNSLYVRPDTGNPIATIATSRGCGAKCTTVTPIISGTHIGIDRRKHL